MTKSVFAPNVYSRFKEVVVEVIWQNLGNCRESWFPPVNSTYSHKNVLTEFRVDVRSSEIDDVCVFVYGNYICHAIFDES